MWYSNGRKPALDMTKPITCVELVGGKYTTYLLLPKTGVGSYDVAGYDWFNLTDGSWNSGMTWRTPEDAIDAYASDGKKIFNAELVAHPND
ncbi:hypothetical protein N9937_00160 [bacterium]|nr:hypothetical protein [bacterium]